MINIDCLLCTRAPRDLPNPFPLLDLTQQVPWRGWSKGKYPFPRSTCSSPCPVAPSLGLRQKASSSQWTLLSILQKGALLYPPNHSTHQPVTCPSRHLHCLVDSFIHPLPSNYTRCSLQAPSVSFITSYSLSPKTTPRRCSINLLN